MSWRVSFLLSRTARETPVLSPTELQQAAAYRYFCYISLGAPVRNPRKPWPRRLLIECGLYNISLFDVTRVCRDLPPKKSARLTSEVHGNSRIT